MNREKKDWGCGGGLFKIDFPGVGMVTADDDGEGDNISASFHERGKPK